MFWHDLAWPEIEPLSKDLPVVIPLAACEQHGRHLPVLVDTIQVTGIAERVEAQLSEEILLLPTLWLGSSHHHKDFPGTVSLRPLLYAQVIQDVARSILEAGFRRLFFLNGHGGNRVPAADALSDLISVEDRADNAYLVLSSWWEISGEAIQAEKVGLEQPVVSHACSFETSLMMVLRPDLVHREGVLDNVPALQNDWFHSEDDSSKKVAVFRRFHRFSESGQLGKLEEANVESGKAILAGATNEIVAFLKDFATWPELPGLKPS